MENQFDTLLENVYNGMKTRVETKRTRYPKINLNESFVEELLKQVERSRGEGMNDKVILQRLQKALSFYI